MIYIYIFSILNVLALIIGTLFTVAFCTILERKVLGITQARLGPNFVGYEGLLQAFADAIKLLIKEYILPTLSNIVLFCLGPVITLIFALLAYAMVPYGPGISLNDFYLGLLFMLAVSSAATYGILLAGWSANSKYAFLGSLRSSAQLISYELIISSTLLIPVFLSTSLNLQTIIEMQKIIWYGILLFPLFVIFLISAIAETNRTPFDLAEAESELVSGFMTEHSASVFVFFFLAEYASIILICILTTIVLLGGYNLFDIFFVFNFLFEDIITYPEYTPIIKYTNYTSFIENSITLNSLILAIKSHILVFTFIWVRSTLPRIRYDQLMSFCWTILLPLIICVIIFVPCIIYILGCIPVNINLV